MEEDPAAPLKTPNNPTDMSSSKKGRTATLMTFAVDLERSWKRTLKRDVKVKYPVNCNLS